MADLKTRSGQKVTAKLVSELATEAEAGYDLASAERVRVGPGRPSLGEGESPRITYRVAPSLFEQARALAREEGRTISDIAREALQRYLF